MTDSQFNTIDPPHEVMLRDYLSATLDGQLGGAEARFRQFLAEREPATDRRPMFRLPHRLGGWALGLGGAALAASLAALVAAPSLRQVAPGGSGNPENPGATVVRDPLLVQQEVQSQTFDDGATLIDGTTPVRVLHRRDLQRTRWFDQKMQLQGEQIIPQDHVVYVKMKTY